MGGLNLHLYPSDLTHESRMMKITAALAEQQVFSEILLVGILTPGTEPVEVIDKTRRMLRFSRGLAPGTGGFAAKAWATLRWSFAVWRHFAGKPVTCINCHSLPVLLLCAALKIRHRATLIYDTHELETETTESRGARRMLAKCVERALIRFADATFVVGETIADWYRDTYRMPRPYVVRNISDPAPFDVQMPSPLRARLGLAPDAMLILYLGRIAPNRGLERMMRLVTQCKSLHFALIGAGPMVEAVKAMAAVHANLHYLPPVPSAEVVDIARGADIGLSVIDHSCLSYTYAMPNKLFEYLQAGVPVLIGNMPEQRAIIDAHSAGWVMPEDDDAAALLFLQSLSRSEIDAKKAGAAAASHVYSWSHERAVLLAAYTKIFNA
ncbi:MAG: glycosyltransferase [Rickettsiales bacterium]